jgi:hypothetical protein
MHQHSLPEAIISGRNSALPGGYRNPAKVDWVSCNAASFTRVPDADQALTSRFESDV